MTSPTVVSQVSRREYSRLDSLVADVCRQIVEYLGFSTSVLALAATSSTWFDYVRFSWVYYERLRSKYPFRFRIADQMNDDFDPLDVDWRRPLVAAAQSKDGQITNPGSRAQATKSNTFTSKIGNRLSRLFGKEKKTQRRTIMIGLDAAGTTTTLYKLKLGEVLQIPPTLANVESIFHKNTEFICHDMAGQEKIRALWYHYYYITEAVIFVVDSSDRERIRYAGSEFHRVVDEMSKERKERVPFLILANKQDLPGVMSCDDVAVAFDLDTLPETTWCVQESCAITGAGLNDGLNWLIDMLES